MNGPLEEDRRPHSAATATSARPAPGWEMDPATIDPGLGLRELLLAGITERAAGSASQGSASLQAQEVHGHSSGEAELLLGSAGKGGVSRRSYLLQERPDKGGYARGQDLLQGAQQRGQAMDLN